MPDDKRASASSDAHRATDLARIRDNQRRCRQRRKEYLQDLEAKYRNCELIGIGASAELQAVARQVVEENKRLRALLVKHGVSGSEIEGADGGAEKARELEGLIGRRKFCGGSKAGGGGGRDEEGARLESCEKSLEEMRQQHGQMPEKGRRWSKEELADVRPLASLSSHAGFGEHPRAGGMSEASSTMDAESLHSQVQTLQAYDQYAGYSEMEQEFQHWPHPQNMEEWPQEMMIDSRSCRDVADAIRYVRPTLSQRELEEQMGCQPGTDCNVPNQEAFDLMDRLSEAERR